MSRNTFAHRRLLFPLVSLLLLSITFYILFIVSSSDCLENERFGIFRPIITHLSLLQQLATTRKSISNKICNNNKKKDSELYIKYLICKVSGAKIWDTFHQARSYYQKVIHNLIQLKKKCKSAGKKGKKNIFEGYLSRYTSASLVDQERDIKKGLTKREKYDPYPSIVTTLQNNKEASKRRIGIACDPQEKILRLEDDRAEIQGIAGDGLYSGMVLQIFPSSFDLAHLDYVTNENYNEDTTTSIELRSSSGTSIIGSNGAKANRQPCKELSTFYKSNEQLREIDENYNNALLVKEYILLEVMHGSLGRIDFHNRDYAYRPVIKLLGTTGDGANYYNTNKQSWFWDESGSESDYEKMGKRAFAGGSHGEVWKARRKCNQVEQLKKDKHNHQLKFPSSSRREQPSQYKNPQYQHKRYFHDATSCNDEKELILKRIKVGKDVALYEAGLREIYFGDILNRSDESRDLFTTYIDHFFLHQTSFGSRRTELWIVYENAGPSLRSYIYTPVTSGDFILYQHSSLWHRLRLEFASRLDLSKVSSSVAVVPNYGESTQTITFVKPDGTHSTIDVGKKNMDDSSSSKTLKGEVESLMKDILAQIIRSAAKLHERGIIHRDIKPSNIMCRARTKFDEIHVGINCVLGDFSSAWDDFSSENFYSNGPSASEQTNEYAPPEVLFGEKWTPFDKSKPESYDSWSIGVVILELLLGTPNVFSVDQRTTTLLTNKMKKEGASEKDIQRALYLAALSQFCIYVPTNESDKSWPLRKGDPLFKASIVKKTCTIHDFHSALRARDPLGIGFDDSIDPLLRLIWGLLAWDPKDRLTASEAMEHFYFENEDYRDDDEYNALQPQMLDPRLDTDIGKGKIDLFLCPKCGRKFDNLQSCQAHATGRRHAKFCTYDRTSLPPCLNAHSMLPSHPTSGYCDIQGRRRVIEDFHTVHLGKDHQFFGVFDGHNGNLASKYAASELYKEFVKHLGDIDDDVQNTTDWKKEVKEEMNQSFEQLHKGVLDVIKSYPTGAVMSKSGTTATALFVTEYAVVVASVGDSRAVLSKGTSFDTENQASSIQLTFDHVASNKDERKRIEDLGGVLSFRGGVLRVNGTLVLSRSIGDAHLERFLSRTPGVVAMTKQEVKNQCKISKVTNDENEMPCFIILASDGLWDVFTNQEAVDLVEKVIQKYDPTKGQGWEENGGAFQEAAEVLTQEAYVRGSSDNIGVCVVAIT